MYLEGDRSHVKPMRWNEFQLITRNDARRITWIANQTYAVCRTLRNGVDIVGETSLYKHLIFRLLRSSIVEWQPRFAYPPICWKSRSGYRQVFRSNIHVPLSKARRSRRAEAADSSLPEAKRIRIFHGITNCQLKYDKHGIVW